MQVLHANTSQFSKSTIHADWFPTPQPLRMTIVSNYRGIPTVPHTSSVGSNPLIRVTLPKEFCDDPLASPIACKTLPPSFNEPEPEIIPDTPVITATSTASSGFGSVFTRRRQASIEKKPPTASTTPPLLRRGSSAPLSASLLVSKMAPMLRRVVSNSKPTSDEDEEGDEDSERSHESLLMLLRVPVVTRESDIPLMMATHAGY